MGPYTRLAVALGAALAALAGAAPGSAHFELALYTQRSCFGSDVDPVTNVFWDGPAVGLVANHVEHHTGWRNDAGRSQWFTSHGRCDEYHAQRASGGSLSTRFHARLSPMLDTSPWPYAAGAAHHEDVTYCGHAVDKTVNGWSGFDMARRALYEAMRGSHEYDYVNYGNTRQFRQCDGDYAGSNGIVGWWRIPAWGH